MIVAEIKRKIPGSFSRVGKKCGIGNFTVVPIIDGALEPVPNELEL